MNSRLRSCQFTRWNSTKWLFHFKLILFLKLAKFLLQLLILVKYLAKCSTHLHILQFHFSCKFDSLHIFMQIVPINWVEFAEWFAINLRVSFPVWIFEFSEWSNVSSVKNPTQRMLSICETGAPYPSSERASARGSTKEIPHRSRRGRVLRKVLSSRRDAQCIFQSAAQSSLQSIRHFWSSQRWGHPLNNAFFVWNSYNLLCFVKGLYWLCLARGFNSATM